MKAYRRVSTQTQTEKYGLEVQREEIEKYAKEHGIEITEWYEDDGISGATDDSTLDINRPGMSALLSSLTENDKIIVLNTSRLWRNDTSKVLIRHELAKVHADIVSIEQPNYTIYYKDPNDFLINSILEILDEYDKLLITRKLANGRRAKAHSGTKGCGSAPIGYRWHDADIEIDVENSVIVTDVFRAYVELKSFGRVAEYCKLKGYKTLQGNDFSKQAVKNILQNDFYVGVVTHAGKKYRGTQPTFITTELYNTVQIMMGREPIEKEDK